MIRALLTRLGVTAAVGALTVAGLAAPAAAQAAGRGTVQGTFTTAGGAVIAGAYIQIWDENFTLKDGNSDRNGRFTITNVPAGPIKVKFHSGGNEQWAHHARDIETATLFTLEPNATLTVDETLLPTGSIGGTVTEANGDVSTYYAAVVHPVDGDGAEFFAYPDETGRWSADVLPGRYTVSFERDATEQWAFGQSDPAAAAVVTVRAGEATDVSDTFLPTGSLGGTLTTAGGEPLAGANVVLHRPYVEGSDRPDAWVTDTFTDETGAYQFAGALPGDYRISFTTDGDAPRQWLADTINPRRAQLYRVTAGAATTADGRQMRPGVLRGTLTDSAGAPLAGYFVGASLDDPDNYEQLETTTRADGTWTLPTVYPGDYLVTFQNSASGRAQWAYGRTSPESAARILVTSGATTTVDDTWLPGATLVVNPVDAATGAPVTDGFCVELETADARQCVDQGPLTFADLAPGRQTISVRMAESSRYLPSERQDVTLVAGQTTTTSVPVQLGGRVAITVTDADGRPVRRTCFILIEPGTGGPGDGYGNCTDGNGKVSTQAEKPGTYQLFAVAPDGYGHQWVGADGGTGDQRAAARVVVRAGRTIKAPEVRLDRPGTIAGTVTGADGAPVASADVSITAWGYGVGPSFHEVADAQGRYEIGRLGPYAWPLSFTAAGYPRQWSGNTGNRFQAQAVAVTTGGRATYDMALKRSSTLTGRVSVVPGAPDSSWRIEAFNAVTGDVMGVADRSDDGDGTYEMPVAGGQTVQIGWDVADEQTWQSGWWENATDRASAAKVSVPKDRTKKLDLVIGRP